MTIKISEWQQMVIHAIVVFAVAFGSVVATAGPTDWTWGLVAAGASAGASAAMHWLVGLLPGSDTATPAKPASTLIVPPAPPAA